MRILAFFYDSRSPVPMALAGTPRGRKPPKPEKAHKVSVMAVAEGDPQDTDQQPGRLMPDHYVLKNQFRILGQVGAGSFGQIYRARVLSNDKDLEVAVKAVVRQQRATEAKRAVLEQKILRDLSGMPNFPKLYSSGKETIGQRTFNYMVMDLLGPNLAELRKRRPEQRLEAVTVYRIGLQGLKAMEVFHKKGYVHRDIKPHNMCIGQRGEKQRIIYLLDFGLAREIRDAKGKLITRRNGIGFRGTVRYASLNAHRRYDQCAVDDLVAFYYTLCELADGRLPWSHLVDDMQVFNMKDQKKQRVSKRMPIQFQKMYDILDFELDVHCPDYPQLATLLESLLAREPKNDPHLPFEWEPDLNSVGDGDPLGVRRSHEHIPRTAISTQKIGTRHDEEEAPDPAQRQETPLKTGIPDRLLSTTLMKVGNVKKTTLALIPP
ncbi:unnamed protein product, partial [Mesorhabditis spiculigera]